MFLARAAGAALALRAHAARHPRQPQAHAGHRLAGRGAPAPGLRACRPRVAGVAGALLAQTTQFVGIESIGFNRSAEVLIILVLGGTGRLYGGMIGAIVYMLVHDWFADLNPEYWMFWLGIFLIAAVMLGRGGIMGALSRWSHPHRGARAMSGAICTHCARAAWASRFGAFHAVDDVNLTLEPGARQALIGPNGAGKTTLINLLTGVFKPTHGTIHMGEREHHRARRPTSAPAWAWRAPSRSTRCSRASRRCCRWCWRSASAKGWAPSGGARSSAQHGGVRRSACAARPAASSTRLADVPVAELAYGKQRLLEIALALAARPAHPAARRARRRRARGRERRTLRSHRRTAAGHQRAVHRARHEPGVPFLAPHLGAGGRPHPDRRHARPRSAATRACARSTWAMRSRPCLRCWPSTSVIAGYGNAVVLDRLSFSLAQGAEPGRSWGATAWARPRCSRR